MKTLKKILSKITLTIKMTNSTIIVYIDNLVFLQIITFEKKC